MVVDLRQKWLQALIRLSPVKNRFKILKYQPQHQITKLHGNKYYVDHNFLNRLTGGQIGGNLDMRGHTIKYLKFDNADSAAARVAELNLKLNRSGGAITGDLVLQKKIPISNYW